MNITKEQADRVTVLAVRIAVWLPGESETGRALKNDAAEIADIMRGLAEDTELLALFAASQKQLPLNAAISATSPQAAQTEADELLRKWNLDPDLYRTDSGALNHMKIAAALKHPDDYPHTAQTAVKSESLAQAAQALAQPPSEGKTIEALAPIQAAQTEAQNGCLSNCRNCQHFRRDTGGHCYMFKEEPQGVCAQFKASWAFW